MLLNYIVEFLKELFDVYLKMAPYLFLGLAFAGLLHLFFSKDFIKKHLGKDNLWSVIKASILGVPLPLCSCGVVPTALSLKKNMASNGATVSFLISTPQTGVDSILATYGMMGPVFAVFRPLASFVMGIVGGIMTNFMSVPVTKVTVDDNCSSGNCSSGVSSDERCGSLWERIKGAFRYGFVEMLDDIAPQVIFGLILSAIISFVVPDNFFEKHIGNNIVEMLIMVAGGIPLYICATGSIPIAVALMAKGVSPGAAFVFLAVGPATNAATIALISKAMGKRITTLYVSTIAILSLIGGVFLNYIYSHFSLQSPVEFMTAHHYMVGETSFFIIAVSVLFFFLLTASLLRKYFPSRFASGENLEDKNEVAVFTVEGMSCGNCAKHVEEAVSVVDDITSVAVNLHEKKLYVEGKFTMDNLSTAIKEAGYTLIQH